MRISTRNPFVTLATSLCALALIVGLSACDSTGPPQSEPAQPATIAERIQNWPELTPTFATAVDSADLVSTLNDENSTFTVFATPLNDVDVEQTLSDEGRLQEILRYHVVQGEELSFADLQGRAGESLETLNGTVSVGAPDDTTVTINGASVRTKDIDCTNGVVHIVDRTLLENQPVATRIKLFSRTSTLEQALATAGVIDAPSSATGSKITGEGPFTVFAPVNDAFNGIEAGTLLNSDVLGDVLNYHVVPQRLTASDLSDGQTLETVAGEELTIDIETFTDTTGAEVRTVLVNGKGVVQPDLEGTNGIVHTTSGVLLENQSVATRVTLEPTLATLENALGTAQLASALGEGNGPFTVFAPEDASFSPINGDSLTSDQSRLQDVLQYHVVPQRLTASDLSDGQALETLSNDEVRVSISDGTVRINGSEVTTANVSAKNGVIHQLGGVLTENQTVADQVRLFNATQDLATLLTEAGLIGTFDNPNQPYTVFAPSGQAVGTLSQTVREALLRDENAPLLQRVLTYHATDGSVPSNALSPGDRVETLEGESVTIGQSGGNLAVNGIGITGPDQRASNGYFHLIDGGVLTPSLDAVERPLLEERTLLASALSATGIRQDVKDANDITLFAPPNAAFQNFLEARNADSFGDLSEAQTDTLREALEFHVATQEVASASIADGDSVETLQGGYMNFSVSGGTITIEGAAEVGQADRQVSNGLYHGIDAILLPREEEIPPL